MMIAVLLAATYELTPAKRGFLAGCRTKGPAAETSRSALRRAIANGGTCIGCCGGLMVALFALGEMSITWMIVLTAVIAAQKLLPWRAATIATAAALLLGLGIGLAASPAHVPGLTIPGGGSAMHAMQS
jgi:predicted metal-binding membrane protein